MESIKVQGKRHICRRTDIVRMFFDIANAIRLNGKDLFFTPMTNGIQYTFSLGSNRITYTVEKGGEL